MTAEHQQIKRIHDAGTKGDFAYALGIQINEVRQGYCEGELSVEPWHLNKGGIMHGGCMFTILDTIAGTAARTYGKVVTSSSDVHFFRPARAGERLFSRAETIRAGSTLVVMGVSVYNEDDKPISQATITYFRLEDRKDSRIDGKIGT